MNTLLYHLSGPLHNGEETAEEHECIHQQHHAEKQCVEPDADAADRPQAVEPWCTKCQQQNRKERQEIASLNAQDIEGIRRCIGEQHADHQDEAEEQKYENHPHSPWDGQRRFLPASGDGQQQCPCPEEHKHRHWRRQSPVEGTKPHADGRTEELSTQDLKCIPYDAEHERPVMDELGEVMQLHCVHVARRGKFRCLCHAGSINITEDLPEIHEEDGADDQHTDEEYGQDPLRPRPRAPLLNRDQEAEKEECRVDHLARGQQQRECGKLDHVFPRDAGARLREGEIEDHGGQIEAERDDIAVVAVATGELKGHRKERDREEELFSDRRTADGHRAEDCKQEEIHEAAEQHEADGAQLQKAGEGDAEGRQEVRTWGRLHRLLQRDTGPGLRRVEKALLMHRFIYRAVKCLPEHRRFTWVIVARPVDEVLVLLTDADVAVFIPDRLPHHLVRQRVGSGEVQDLVRCGERRKCAHENKPHGEHRDEVDLVKLPSGFLKQAEAGRDDHA